MGNYKKKGFSYHKIISFLLKELHVKVTDKVLKQAIEEQKNYQGTIRIIKEVLRDFEIESKVYRVEYNELLSLECPFIAHIEDLNPSFVVVKDCSEKTVNYFDSINGHNRVSVSDFIRKWRGIILVPIVSEQSGDPEYMKNLYEEKRTRRLKMGFVSLIIILFNALIFKTILVNSEQLLIWLGFTLCKCLGVFISAKIVKIEYGNSDNIIDRLCSNSGCKKVLHSRGAKLFSWLSMGDIGIIYFVGGLFLLCTNNYSMYPVLNILIFLNFLALPYTFYSVFYQFKIAKDFCPFCCTVIVLLWLEFLIGLFIGFKLSSFDLPIILFSLINYLMVAILWFIFRPFIKSTSIATNYKTILSGIKKDVELFNSFISSQLTVPRLSVKNEITLGDPNAKNTLIAIISPSCHSCYQLYSEIKLYSIDFPERLKIILRFKGSDEEDSELNKVIDWIITLHILGKSTKVFELYESWNMLKQTGIKKWEEVNKLLGETIIDEAVHTRISYTAWINLLDIPGTPAIIFNNRILPVYYTFFDIKYLIKQLDEIKDNY